MVIVDFKSLIKIAMIAKSYELQIQHVLKDKANRSPKKDRPVETKEENQSLKKSSFKLVIQNSFV
jgi:hypothetical protein